MSKPDLNEQMCTQYEHKLAGTIYIVITFSPISMSPWLQQTFPKNSIAWRHCRGQELVCTITVDKQPTDLKPLVVLDPLLGVALAPNIQALHSLGMSLGMSLAHHLYCILGDSTHSRLSLPAVAGARLIRVKKHWMMMVNEMKMWEIVSIYCEQEVKLSYCWIIDSWWDESLHSRAVSFQALIIWEFRFLKFMKQRVTGVLGRRPRLDNILFPEYGNRIISHVAVTHRKKHRSFPKFRWL